MSITQRQVAELEDMIAGAIQGVVDALSFLEDYQDDNDTLYDMSEELSSAESSLERAERLLEKYVKEEHK